MCWHFACLQMSTLWLFISLLEHYQCFPHEDVCLIFILGSVSRNTVPRGVFPNTLAREQEVCWKILSLKIMSFNIIPVASEYQEKHPYGVENIDSVKINTTMMREWPILKKRAHGFMSKTWFSLIPDTRNTRWFWKLIGYGSGIEKYFGFGSGIGYPLVPALRPRNLSRASNFSPPWN